LGVNVLGWSYKDVAQLLSEVNIIDPEVVDNIYNMAVGVPLNSVNYSLGYIELIKLLEHAENQMGEDFALIDFHRFFLDFGPAPYPIILKYMDEYIQEQESQALQPAA